MQIEPKSIETILAEWGVEVSPNADGGVVQALKREREQRLREMIASAILYAAEECKPKQCCGGNCGESEVANEYHTTLKAFAEGVVKTEG